MSLLLTEAERLRFADYCALQAESADGIAKQMASVRTPEMVIRHIRTEAAAFKIVEQKLRSMESMTVEPGGPTSG